VVVPEVAVVQVVVFELVTIVVVVVEIVVVAFAVAVVVVSMLRRFVVPSIEIADRSPTPFETFEIEL
jgi:hypothetical protein